MTDIERCKEFYSKYPDGTFADSVEAEFARDMFYAGWDAFAECVKESQQWKTIDTAPKDGTKVLLMRMGEYGRCGMADGYYNERSVWVWPYVMKEPTHWMPLPPAPNATGKE
ncbi:MAG TPA: DUF551 domain-containing protein [Methanosarcina sp.]|nr:DUF551 domain-containing protein [Methanosarcina sp.]